MYNIFIPYNANTGNDHNISLSLISINDPLPFTRHRVTFTLPISSTNYGSERI